MEPDPVAIKFAKGGSINLFFKHSKMLMYLPRYVLEPIYIYKVKKCKMP
jgi:hypothetical protein